jgi:hypothetical protein
VRRSFRYSGLVRRCMNCALKREFLGAKTIGCAARRGAMQRRLKT